MEGRLDFRFLRYRVRKKYGSRASLLYLTIWRMVAWLL